MRGRYRTVTEPLPSADWFFRVDSGTRSPHPDRRHRSMIQQSSLRAPLSLVALPAACSPEPPAGPSPSRPSASVTVPIATDDAGATYAVIGDMPYGKGKLDSLPQLIEIGR